MKGLQKVVRWFLDANDNPNSHQNIIITFWPIYYVLWNLHANLFRGICINSTNQQAKSMRKQLISLAQVIKFCKISSSRVFFNPNPPLLRTPLVRGDPLQATAWASCNLCTPLLQGIGKTKWHSSWLGIPSRTWTSLVEILPKPLIIQPILYWSLETQAAIFSNVREITNFGTFSQVIFEC